MDSEYNVTKAVLAAYDTEIMRLIKERNDTAERWNARTNATEAERNSTMIPYRFGGYRTVNNK